MSVPRFPSDKLDASGTPIWISELASFNRADTIHVVRGREPADALEALGADPQLFRPCILTGDKPDDWTSLPAAALGIEKGDSDGTLLAGRLGPWTFIYDDWGATSHDDTTELSADGRTAATSMYSINADASLTYAVDGTQLVWINADDLDLEADLPGMPPELRAAFAAARRADHDDRGDYQICTRAICALAGLYCTVEDLHRIPLVVTPFG